MKTLLAAAVLTFAASAAGATFTSLPGAPDPGPAMGEMIYVDFNGALPAGVTLTGGLIQSGSNGQGASPAGDGTAYLTTTGSSTLDFTAALGGGQRINTLSFYWGSIDQYNDLDLLGVGGAVFQTINGSIVPPANGNQSASNSNQRVFLTFAANETLTGLRFRSGQPAFEVDDIAASVGAVPEPGTWAMMIVGFGLVGVAARRRNQIAVIAA